MGQDITVTPVPSVNDTAHVYSLNRSLTGMEIVTFCDASDITDQENPAFVCAKRLLELGVDSVSIYSNTVTINCSTELFSKIEKNITATLENLFRYYGDDAGWSDDALTA